MTNAWIIARNTFREAVRDRVLYAILVFAVVAIGGSKAIGWVMVGEDIKVMTDIGFASVAFFSVLIAIFVGTGLVHREIDKKTLYTVLARPVHRWEFLVGKYAGLMLTVLVNMAIMSVLFLVYLRIMGLVTVAGTDNVAPPVLTYMNLQALVLTAAELAVVTAIAVFFSSASTPILSAILTTIAYAAGHTSDWIMIMVEMLRPAPGAELTFWQWLGQWILTAVYYLVPNLEIYNIRNLAVHSELVSVQPLAFWHFTDTCATAICWVLVAMLLSVLVFGRREL